MRTSVSINLFRNDVFDPYGSRCAVLNAKQKNLPFVYDSHIPVDHSLEGCVVTSHSLEESISAVAENDRIVIIAGPEIIRPALALADHVYVTRSLFYSTGTTISIADPRFRLRAQSIDLRRYNIREYYERSFIY